MFTSGLAHFGIDHDGHLDTLLGPDRIGPDQTRPDQTRPEDDRQTLIAMQPVEETHQRAERSVIANVYVFLHPSRLVRPQDVFQLMLTADEMEAG
jgi:hypothetical protein